jgi:hypothetical protein
MTTIYLICKYRREFLNYCEVYKINPTSKEISWIMDYDTAIDKLKGVINPKVRFYGQSYLIDKIRDIRILVESKGVK